MQTSFLSSASESPSPISQPQIKPNFKREKQQTNQSILRSHKSPHREIVLTLPKFKFRATRQPQPEKKIIPVNNFSFAPNVEEIVWIASVPLKIDWNKKREKWVDQLSETCSKLNFWSKIIGGTISKEDAFGIQLQLEDFGTRIWDLHARIIMFLGHVDIADGSRFEHEEENISSWLSKELRISDELTKEKPGGIREPHGRMNWNFFIDALYAPSSKERQKVWGISHGSKKQSPSTVWVVYEKQFYATKAAIQTLGSYFKSNNLKKWIQIFNEDERFIRDFLKDIRRSHTLNAVILDSKRKRLPVPASNVLPWEAEVTSLTTSATKLLTHYNSTPYKPACFSKKVFELSPNDSRTKRMCQPDDQSYDILRASIQGSRPVD
ncbi:hypothetical protein O181_019436 [Austropuccinia psidii MF-1]|uniref:Uncharacterized protein n=1 Tax=Austropuccinia psidii MF-1 TaxID=1389203 RepID=A0A9Q3CBJ4_9BASI|nr:hypothetical protein [Austropuccinia psidii MF-1]